MNEYKEFLEKKRVNFVPSGFDIDESQLNPILFPFQKFCVKRALEAGKYALFEDCGLGKTFQQLEWARIVSLRESAPVLILCPLAVSGQTINEGKKLGIEVLRYDGAASGPQIYISNYDQLENIDCGAFCGIVLDESSILKNFEGSTRNLIIEKFAETPYKLACTATPSPNDPMELGNHAEFLGAMTRAQMLAMYFIHDGGDTSKWRLKGHAVNSFWKWVAQWAIMLRKPHDIGFEMNGYDLPPLNIMERQIVTPKRENGQLFNDMAVSATEFNGELRITLLPRIEAVAEIVNNSTESFIVWIKQDAEGDLIKKMIPDAIEVRGSDKPDIKEKRLMGFANGEFRVLVTKAKIAQFGMNFQNCHNQVFASSDFSFEAPYQQIRRSYRFGQFHPVNVWMVTTDTMENVRQAFARKQYQFDEMQLQMTNAMGEFLNQEKEGDRVWGDQFVENDQYKIYRGDCCQLIQSLSDQSVGFSVFSPPFADLYTYSDELADMGNSTDYGQFVQHFQFLCSELYRVLKSGRNVSIHCMDLPIQKGKEGFIGLRDFSGTIIQAMQSVGFIYHSRVTIWKDPVTEMQRTKALGLLHKQVKKDSTMSRVGICDYVLTFRKDGERNEPVMCGISVDTWQKYASPVWMDIDYGDTLNREEARGENDEKHICPLQLPTIERLIHLYTNEGDIVLTPFMGIGSEVYQAVKMNRKGVGFELKESYFDTAKKNCISAAESKKQLALF
jgi:DNA modification methylase